jgi:hypothetical protein
VTCTLLVDSPSLQSRQNGWDNSIWVGLAAEVGPDLTFGPVDGELPRRREDPMRSGVSDGHPTHTTASGL